MCVWTDTAVTTLYGCDMTRVSHPGCCSSAEIKHNVCLQMMSHDPAAAAKRDKPTPPPTPGPQHPALAHHPTLKPKVNRLREMEILQAICWCSTELCNSPSLDGQWLLYRATLSAFVTSVHHAGLEGSS